MLFRVKTAKQLPLPREHRFWTSKLAFEVAELRENSASPVSFAQENTEHLLGTSEKTLGFAVLQM